MDTTLLRDLVAGRINQRWEPWSQAHPHLAAAIDRIRLIESAVARLTEDPEFRQAMQQADIDVDKLSAAVQLVELAERWITRLLPL